GGIDEISCALGHRRLRVRVVARAEHHHEQLHVDDVTRVAVDDVRLLAREVDERLLAGAMRLSHRERELRLPPCVEIAKLAVLIRELRAAAEPRCFLVLNAQSLQRDTSAAQLAVYPLEVDRDALRRLAATERSEQLRLELDVVERLRR